MPTTQPTMAVTHVAGPMDPSGVQRCVRCDVVLKQQRVDPWSVLPDTGLHRACGGAYPEGALIERGACYQAMVFRLGVRLLCDGTVP